MLRRLFKTSSGTSLPARESGVKGGGDAVVDFASDVDADSDVDFVSGLASGAFGLLITLDNASFRLEIFSLVGFLLSPVLLKQTCLRASRCRLRAR